MAKDRTRLAALVQLPFRGGARAGSRSGRSHRGHHVEFLVIGLLVLLVVPALIHTGRSQVTAERAQISLSLTSDPSDASVIIDDLWVGRTPLTVDLPLSEEFSLRLEAREPYLEYDLYKPYRASLTLEGDRNLHVWLPRTSAAEQAAQRAAVR